MLAKLGAAIALLCASSSTCPTAFRAHEGAAELAYEFVLAADARELDVTLLAGLAWEESRYSPRAVSPRGAVGIMQVMRKFWAPHGLCRNHRCLRRQVQAGATALAWFKRRCVHDGPSIRAYRRGWCGPPVAKTRLVLRTRDRLREAIDAR